MDAKRLARLQALTGVQDIVSTELNSEQGWGANLPVRVVENQLEHNQVESVHTKVQPKSKSHVYEGSDDEEEGDYEITTSCEIGIQSTRDCETEESHHTVIAQEEVLSDEPDVSATYEDYQLGQLAPEGNSFCPLIAVKKYPYTYVGDTHKQLVAESFFDKNQLLDENTWDLFYIHRKLSGFSDAIILVPTQQFQAFLANINHELDTQLTIPPGRNSAFEIIFEHDVGTPCPRYLGRSKSYDMVERMKKNIPPVSYRTQNEKGSQKIQPNDRSLEAFRLKIELLANAQKNKKKVVSERKKAERIADKMEWGHSLKRVQRYLGLRQTRTLFHTTSRGNTAELPHTEFRPDKLAPFVFEQDAVFICVDVEAYERDNNKITEIGISTLDTRDLAHIAPGVKGKNWQNAIRARHFRISDYKHLVNKEFVDGCPDRFETKFGTSEFITLAESPAVVASCFRFPFSKKGVKSTGDDAPKRNVILVGHDTKQDVKYLRKIGYNVYNLPNMMEEVDTASMWRHLTRDQNPRSLGTILGELGIIGWNLHNAGNDAAYTLQAMIGIAVKAIVDKQKGRHVVEAEKAKRVADAVTEAQAAALEREAEWNSNDESDGGKPKWPGAAETVPDVPKNLAKTYNSKYSSLPWDEQQPKPFVNNPSLLFVPQDPKARRAQKMAQRRGWGYDAAAEEGGWDNSVHVPAIKGGDFSFEGSQHSNLSASKDSSASQSSTSQPSQPSQASQSSDIGQHQHQTMRGGRIRPREQPDSASHDKFGNLEQHFVSAGYFGEGVETDGGVDRIYRKVTEGSVPGEGAVKESEAEREMREFRKGHIDAW